MAALITSRRDADFSGRELIGNTKKSAVRTGIGAKAFLPQKINRHKTADEKKRDGHCNRRESLPKISGHQMIGEFRENRFVRRVPKQSIRCWPDKHVQRADERDIHQEPRSKRFRMKAHFL